MGLAILILFTCSVAQLPLALTSPAVSGQDRSGRISELLKQLAPVEIKQGDRVLIKGADAWVLERVHKQLILMANESLESRDTVIRALMAVAKEPKTELHIEAVTQWRTAVLLLGELKATEAIDDLVRNLGHTSYVGVYEKDPLVRNALVRIGKPAIPRLLGALSDPNPRIRSEASNALGEIGAPALEGLLKALSGGEPSVRAGAAAALSRVGGIRARKAIEAAIAAEADERVKEELRRAVLYMDHVESLRRGNR